jgi:tetratricopeptide (TPR) repeat protein
MLHNQPRREDFPSHGALAAALAGDHVSAVAWAEQLREQAQSRSRTSPRTIEATSLLATVHLVEGEFSDALLTSQTIFDLGKSTAARDPSESIAMQYASVANNAAVLHLFTGGDHAAGASPANGFTRAKQLWLDCKTPAGRSRSADDARAALAEYNLGATALYQSRYVQAASLLNTSLAEWRAIGGPAAKAGEAVNINALAQVSLASGQYAQAESQLADLAKITGAANSDSAASLAFQSSEAQLDTALARYDRAVNAFHKLCHDAEHGAGGLSPNHPYTAILNLRLADALLRAKRFSEAEAAAEECARILAHANLSASRFSADAYRISGSAALRQGKRLLAERQFDRATKLLRPIDETSAPENDSGAVAAAQSESIELVQLLAAEGEFAGELQNYAAAADDYRSALHQLALLFESQAASHPLRAEYLHALAMLFVHEEKLSEAKPLLDESLAIDRRSLPAGHPAAIAVMQDLATLLEKTGAKAQADQLRADVKRLRPRD